MRRVLLHLGFHKTGTTAAQSFLFENRELIWPHHALVLPYRTRKSGLSEAATHYSVYGTPGAMADFSDQMRAFLKTLEFGHRRGLILSEENFSGLRPSRNAAIGYDAAPDIAACLVSLIQDRFASRGADITVYLSLRQRSSWLRSLWAHDLQRTRLVQDFHTYSARLDQIQSPDMAAAAIRDRLEDVNVQTAWLEDLQTRKFGPGGPFADFLDLPSTQAAQLVGPSRVNPRLPENALAEMLEMNRSALDDATLIRHKAHLVQRVQSDLIDLS